MRQLLRKAYDSEMRTLIEALVLLFAALLITSTMDFQDAKKDEARICKGQPYLEFCK